MNFHLKDGIGVEFIAYTKAKRWKNLHWHHVA